MGYEHAQSQRHAGSVSECFWGWKGEPQVLETQLWQYRSQYDAFAVTGKAEGAGETCIRYRIILKKQILKYRKTMTKLEPQFQENVHSTMKIKKLQTFCRKCLMYCYLTITIVT